MTRRLIFTVDVDRDVNIKIDGKDAAGSIDRGNGTNPRFVSSEEGLRIILDMLDGIGVKGTFLMEGRTAETIDCLSLSGHCIGFHGYDHEDLTTVSDPESVMRRGYEAVKDNVSTPVCFRAPYMSIDDRVYGVLSSLGIRHDSSVYAEPGVPSYKVGDVTEHPVAKGKDKDGRTIAAYLWPLHEGKRGYGDYVDLARSMGDGDLILSTHSWHMVERRESGRMSEEDIGKNLEDVKKVIDLILDEGFRPAVLTE